MNKVSITRFIEKYYLNGNCSSVVLKSDGDKLSTRFITGDKNLLGELSMDNFSFDAVEMGVYNTEQLVKLLSVLNEKISIDLMKAGDKAVSLKVSDSKSNVNYMLSDLSVINQAPNMKSVPDFEVKIKVDKSFIQSETLLKKSKSKIAPYFIISPKPEITSSLGNVFRRF